MSEIYEHRSAVKKFGSLPNDILKRYGKWKDIVTISGPTGLRKIRGFREDTFRGEWKGYRSSRLNAQYRVIFSYKLLM